MVERTVVPGSTSRTDRRYGTTSGSTVCRGQLCSYLFTSEAIQNVYVQIYKTFSDENGTI